MEKVVFLDRDGVINRKIEDGYVTEWGEFEFLPGAKEAIEILKRKGFLIIVTTNQRGIAKGLMTEEDLRKIHKRMERELGEENIDAIYFCPHESDERCGCRKPQPGMFREAARKFPIDFQKSYIVGDSESDMEAGKTLKLRRIFIGEESDYHGLDKKSIYFVPDLAQAAKIITEEAL
jgi:D-glycero-D-manno-heptose 1,7-bisphosphate phosphatase